MVWTSLGKVKVGQDWILTQSIASELGYFRFKFESVLNVPIWVSQADPNSPNDIYDQRRIVATTANQILEFATPPFFEDRALALRIPDFPKFLTVEIEVSDAPFSQVGSTAPIPWDSPGAIGSTVPNTGKFKNVTINVDSDQDTALSMQKLQDGLPGVGYSFQLTDSPSFPKLRLLSHFADMSGYAVMFDILGYGEIHFQSPCRLNHPLVLPTVPGNITPGYAFYYSPALFFQGVNENRKLMATADGNLYEIPMQLVQASS